MHPRTAIRAAVAARLQAALPQTGLTHCFLGRRKPTRDEKTPFARVVSGDEASEPLTDLGDEKRTFTVSIRVYVKDKDGIDDELDELAERIENLFWDGAFLDDLATDWRYEGSTVNDGEEDEAAARHEAGTLTLNYECTYRWSPPDTSADLAPFARAHVTTQATAASGVAGAVDHIELPQD